MIARHIPMRSARRSSFKDLVAYITHSKDKMVRIGQVRITNCHQDTPQDAVLEVLATQLRNQRACGDKTYHLLISFPAGESPPDDVLRDIEDEVCQALGFGEHQRVSAAHADTDNLHIHVAINRIHPRTLAIHHPYADYKALGAACERLEHLHGLIHTNHRTIVPGARNRALDMEYLAGVESLLGWVRRECLQELRQAQSWDELHDALGRAGLVVQERGNGLVVSDKEGRTVKASSIARDLSLPQLVKRFGPFEAMDAQLQAGRGAKAARGSEDDRQEREPVEKAYRVRPLARDAGTDALYQRYLMEQAQRLSAGVQIREELRSQKHALVAQAKGRAKVRRGLIRQLDCGRLMKRMLYQQAHSSLRADLQSIHARQKAVHAEKFSHARTLSWHDWLAQQAGRKDEAALAVLRRRGRAARAASSCAQDEWGRGGIGQGRALYGTKDFIFPGGAGIDDMRVEGMQIDRVTKQGTILYSNGKSAIRDSGHRLEVSDGIGQDGLEAALAIAVARFGQSLRIEGDAAFRERVMLTARALRLDIRIDKMRQAELKEDQGRAEEARTAEGGQHLQPSGNIPTFGSAGEAAAQRYIAERELKRQSIAGIPRHVLGERRPGMDVRYAGWRRIDGQFLLLNRISADEIMVIPVEAEVIARVSGRKRGETIALDQERAAAKRIDRADQPRGLRR